MCAQCEELFCLRIAAIELIRRYYLCSLAHLQQVQIARSACDSAAQRLHAAAFVVASRPTKVRSSEQKHHICGKLSPTCHFTPFPPPPHMIIFQKRLPTCSKLILQTDIPLPNSPFYLNWSTCCTKRSRLYKHTHTHTHTHTLFNQQLSLFGYSNSQGSHGLFAVGACCEHNGLCTVSFILDLLLEFAVRRFLCGVPGGQDYGCFVQSFGDRR